MQEVVVPGNQDMRSAVARVEEFPGFGKFVTIRAAKEGRKATAVILSLNELKNLVRLAEAEGASA